jgi:hypothetical protein
MTTESREELEVRWLEDGKLFRKKADEFHAANSPLSQAAMANRDCKITHGHIELRALEAMLIAKGVIDADELLAGMCELLEDEIERFDKLAAERS